MEPTVATLAVALKTIIQDRNARITAAAVVSTVSSTDSTASTLDSTVSSAGPRRPDDGSPAFLWSINCLALAEKMC